MDALGFAIVVAVLAFVAGLVGLRLRGLLPDEHGPDRAREMIGSVTGLLGLLLALVLGTLVGSSYTTYTTQKAEIEMLAAKSLQLDQALAAFGPEAAAGRAGLHQTVQAVYNKIWGGREADLSALSIKNAVASTTDLNNFLLSLQPKTDAQRQLLATANAAAGLITQTRLLMIFQLAGAVSWPMMAIVTFWATLLFCGYGLMARANVTTLATLGLGALSVASAMFLILELGSPYAGLFKIPSRGSELLLEAIDINPSP